MSERNHYDAGAIHNDHHKEINIGTVSESVLKDLISNFFKDDAEDAEVLEEVSQSIPENVENFASKNNTAKPKLDIPETEDDVFQVNIPQTIVSFFTDGTLSVDEPSQLYFLLLAMWARRLLESKEIPSFVRMVGDAYPALFNEERTQEKVIMSLQNMNGKANRYFDEYIKDQSSMVAYIDLMYPKKKNGQRRKDCERVVNLANKLFLALK